MAEIIPNRVPCGNKNGNTTPQVTPVTATTINGITYFKLKPDPSNPRYDGDYTKNCGLLGNEIDENFFYLRNMYIYTAYTQIIDEVRTLVLERVNGDKIYVNLEENASYVVDDEGHILVDGYPIPDENGEPVKFLIEGRDVHIVTDPSVQGDGSYGKPIGVDLAYRTGTYAPADFFVDLTGSGLSLDDFTDIGYGHSIVTRENAGRFGALYTFTQAQKLDAALNRLYGGKGLRVPTKEDWAKLLNWAEGCDGVQNHDTDDCGNFGKFAGQRLKSVGFWDYTEEDKKPVDEFGFGIYPVGVCPEPYNAAEPDTDFGFTGLYKVSTFWSSSVSNGQAYTRTFSYAHNDVGQSTDSVKKRFSIRLVRDIDSDFDVTAYADILGNYLPVILTTDGKQLWTVFNVNITNYDGFDEREVTTPTAWEDVNTNVPAVEFYQLIETTEGYVYVQVEEYEIPSTAIVETVTEMPIPESGSSEYIRYEYLVHVDMSTEPKFYYNAWDGKMWHKKQMMVGESVVILNEDYPTSGDSATTYVTSANTNHEWRVYFNEQTGLDELIDTLEALKEEFAEEFYKLNEKIDELSATTEEFSASTVEEIERLDERVNAIELVEVAPTDPVTLKSYELHEGDIVKGVRIDIPKDKNIKSISTGWSGAVIDEVTGEYTYDPESGDTEVLRIVYQKQDGLFELVEINIEDFIHENEFADGLEVVNHIVKVKIDDASEEVIVQYGENEDENVKEKVLSVSPSGVCVSHIQEAIDAAVAKETERATEAEELLQQQIDEEVSARTEADADLQRQIDEEVSARTAADEHLQEEIDELAAKTIDPADDSVVIEVSGSSTTIRVQISETEGQLKLSDGTVVDYVDYFGHEILIPKGLYLDTDFGEFGE